MLLMAEDVTDHGAVPDDESNDRNAFVSAVEAANGGTVYVPEGTYILDSKWARGGGAVHLHTDDVAGTSFVGDGPDKTTIKMEGGHVNNYIGFKYDNGVDHDGAVIRDMTLDGNQWEQGSSSDVPNGMALQIKGNSQAVVVDNCRIIDWSLNGGMHFADDEVVRNCDFINNGRAVLEVNGYNGHGTNVGPNASSSDAHGCLIENCYFENNAGDSVNNNGVATIRNCFSTGNGKAIKFNGAVRTTIENSRFRDIRRRGVKTVKTDASGLLEMYDVEVSGTGLEAIATRTPGDFNGHNILVTNANSEDFHNGEGIRLENKQVDLGTVCVTGTAHGAVFDVTNSSGSIDELVREENSGGLGTVEDLSIGTDTTGGSISIDAPSMSEVGTSSSGSSPTYDHLLEVQAAPDADLTEYTVEVTGEAVVGPNSNIQESVTQLSNGNYLLEGQVATGGTDDFKFNGEVVAENSSIDGNATAYVDGSEVSLTSTSRTYDHLLEVQAAPDADLTEYTVEVTGEAVVGPNSNIQESVTELSSGNYLLEGQVATGGTDDFKFNGEVVAENSSIDGNAAAYVDGSQVDFSPDGSSDDSGSDSGFGSYTLPEPGSADWHQPLNDNFDQLGQDVQALNDRLNELENQIN